MVEDAVAHSGSALLGCSNAARDLQDGGHLPDIPVQSSAIWGCFTMQWWDFPAVCVNNSCFWQVSGISFIHRLCHVGIVLVVILILVSG